MPQVRTRLSWLAVMLMAAPFTALLSGCAGTPDARAPVEERRPVPKLAKPVVAEPESNFYVVQKGDTLNRIAATHKLTVKDLVAWNELADPNKVEVDQRLRIVPPRSVAQTSPATTGPATAAPVTPVAPLESRPLSPEPGQPAPATIVNAKHEPLAGKQPYSELALAKAKAADSGTVATQPGASGTVATQPDVKPETKPKPAASAEWAWPAGGKVVRGFDGKANKGVDIAGKVGEPVLAVAGGKVAYAGSGLPGYGKVLIIKHNAHSLTVYGNNNQLLVKEGQTVTQGQKIAEMGKGEGDGGRLHFEIRQDSKPVDPLQFLPTR
jgi:lipoprotein NlpD